MPTRQELQVAHDVIRAAHKANRLTWLAGYYAQGYRASIEAVYVLYDEDGNNVRPPERGELITKMRSKLNPAHELADKVAAWLAHSDIRQMAATALAGTEITIEQIEADCETNRAARLYADDMPKIQANKTDLARLGDYLLETPTALLAPTPQMPRAANLLNQVNDCLDAISYVLSGTDAATGDEFAGSLDQAVSYARMWLKAISRLRNAGSPANEMFDAAAAVWREMDSVRSWDDAVAIADTIHSAVPKLPLLRRAWAHG